MAAIDTFHSLTGMPWWATISTISIGIRLSLFPITLKGMKASGALFPLIKQAREDLKHTPPPSHIPSLNSKIASTTETWSAIASKFHALRRRHGAPHPLWILASPLIQLPVFITAVTSIRSMCVSDWPGFSTGGIGWFPDLTQVALDLSSMTAPMGPQGVILPLVIAVSMYVNIENAFSLPPRNTKGLPKHEVSHNCSSNAGNTAAIESTSAWLVEKIKLLLEWAVVPLFVTSLQLPHGTLCYWATTSTLVMAQHRILRTPYVLRRLGLASGGGGGGGGGTNAGERGSHHHHHHSPHHEASSSVPDEQGVGFKVSMKNSNESADGETMRGVPPTMHAADPFNRNSIPEKEAALLMQAAELQAKRDGKGASKVLEDILSRHPLQPRVLFALGQVQSGLKEWHASAESYLQAAEYEIDQQQQCRAWFGAGVAFHMQGNEQEAIEAFQKAAIPAAGAQLQVRAWVSQATIAKKLGQRGYAIELLRKASKIEPKIEELYVKPLLEEEEK